MLVSKFIKKCFKGIKHVHEYDDWRLQKLRKESYAAFTVILYHILGEVASKLLAKEDSDRLLNHAKIVMLLVFES